MIYTGVGNEHDTWDVLTELLFLMTHTLFTMRAIYLGVLSTKGADAEFLGERDREKLREKAQTMFEMHESERLGQALHLISAATAWIWWTLDADGMYIVHSGYQMLYAAIAVIEMLRLLVASMFEIDSAVAPAVIALAFAFVHNSLVYWGALFLTAYLVFELLRRYQMRMRNGIKLN